MNLITDDEELSCKLIDGFAIVVQAVMASVALSALVYKRSIENPQRPLMIWAMDTSKQAIAASIVHFANIAISYISSLIPNNATNPCIWYFLNLLLDTTVGVYILYILLVGVNNCAQFCGLTDIDMGNYGSPPRFFPWFKQLVLFLIAWFFVKVIVGFVLLVCPIFSIVATWMLKPLASNPYAQVIFVMFLFPLCMNVIQGIFQVLTVAWLIDRVIKGRLYTPIPTEAPISEDGTSSPRQDVPDVNNRSWDNFFVKLFGGRRASHDVESTQD
ncbi:vacuolar membrane protein-domain-containing protein [Globomyces pollinis-pini]|nr:vacuolar membrane protein-domain-containing protein [Globomyces pollinis-pini]